MYVFIQMVASIRARVWISAFQDFLSQIQFLNSSVIFNKSVGFLLSFVFTFKQLLTYLQTQKDIVVLNQQLLCYLIALKEKSPVSEHLILPQIMQKLYTFKLTHSALSEQKRYIKNPAIKVIILLTGVWNTFARIWKRFARI